MSANKVGSSKVFYSPRAIDQFSGKVQMKRKPEQPKPTFIQVDKKKYETAIKMVETVAKPEFWIYWDTKLHDQNYKGEKPWNIAADCAKWLKSK